MAKYLDADGLQHYHESLQPSLVRGVTQAEYDVLSEEEKRGLVVITDAQPSGGGGESGGTCEDVYSTEERRIGTWIDGKPIYRKVRPISLKNNTGNQQFDIGLTDVDVVTDLKVIVKMATTSTGWFVSNYMTTGGSVSCGIRLDYLLWVSVLTFNDIAGQPAFAIVEYTKTTDQPEAAT